jgi:hypothetical protein
VTDSALCRVQNQNKAGGQASGFFCAICRSAEAILESVGKPRIRTAALQNTLNSLVLFFSDGIPPTRIESTSFITVFFQLRH